MTRRSKAALAWLIAALLALGCARGPVVVIVAPDGTERAQISVEIADTPGKREAGLMYRHHLDEDSGMLFIFPRAAPQRFWMKNTPIPLDMIFADQTGRIIGIVARAEPYSEKLLGVEGNSRFVLEVNGGFGERHGVRPGDVLRFRGFSPTAAR